MAWLLTHTVLSCALTLTLVRKQYTHTHYTFAAASVGIALGSHYRIHIACAVDCQRQ